MNYHQRLLAATEVPYTRPEAPADTAGRTWQDPTRPVSERVESLLVAMTLEQKAAQLGSYWRPQGTASDQVAPGQVVPGNWCPGRWRPGKAHRRKGSCPLGAAGSPNRSGTAWAS